MVHTGSVKKALQSGASGHSLEDYNSSVAELALVPLHAYHESRVGTKSPDDVMSQLIAARLASIQDRDD